jgi:hypothetical protein
MPLDDPIEEIYDHTFNETVAFLRGRLRNDPALDLRNLEAMLESLYIRQGNNWTGRGEIRDRIESAVIAAHEHMIAELRKAYPEGTAGRRNGYSSA